MKALYRKYRPLKLEDVVGQEQITTPLANSIAQNRIGHAYLFTGPRGTGKTSVARIFAHLVNNFDYELEDDYVDIVEIDGASNRGIDDIREIREKATIKPTLGNYKVYIIDEVHMLTKEAFNALLKTLEEPPSHVIFIMATTDLHKVPATILSRTQVFNFKLADTDIILEHLKKIAEQEKIQIEDAALEIIIKRGGGSFRDSLSLLDQISTISTDKITSKMVEGILGLPEETKIVDILEAYKNSDVARITAVLKTLLNMGVKAEIIAEELIGKIVKNPEDKLLPLLNVLPDIKEPFSEARLIAGLLTNLEPIHIQATGSIPQNSQSPTQAKRSIFRDTQSPVRTTPSTLRNAQSSARTTRSILQDTQPSPQITASKIAGVEESEKAKKTDFKARISAIMGGEVKEYGGGSPF